MSNERQETVSDIVAEMRIGDLCAGDTTSSRPEYINDFLASYADRIEAAWMREREAGAAAACEQPVTDCNQLNNAAAMREALVQVSRIAVEMTRKTITGEPEDRKTVDRWALRLCDIACAALSAPPRNCDVGTAEEQDARHSKWCRKYGIDGDMEVACAHQDMNCTLCALRWAQMPYGEGGAK